MQITLKQFHIEAAIKAYVAKAGLTFPVDEISFTAGRGKDGFTATVEMEDPFLTAEREHEDAQRAEESTPDVAEEPAPVVAPKPRARRTVQEAKPEEVTEADVTAEAATPSPFTPVTPAASADNDEASEEDEPAVTPSAPLPVEKGVSLFG